jgi:hypothetical protein
MPIGMNSSPLGWTRVPSLLTNVSAPRTKTRRQMLSTSPPPPYAASVELPRIASNVFDAVIVSESSAKNTRAPTGTARGARTVAGRRGGGVLSVERRRLSRRRHRQRQQYES